MQNTYKTQNCELVNKKPH